jgi:hypothetical protein
VHVRVVRDTCSPKVVGDLDQKGLLVLGHPASGGKTIVNLPLVVAKSSAIARSDIVAEVGSAFNTKTKPDPTCAVYEQLHSLDVKEVSHHRIVVERTETYGVRTGCAPASFPADCITETEDTFTLVRSECESSCAAQIDMSTPKAPKIKCTCP